MAEHRKKENAPEVQKFGNSGRFAATSSSEEGVNVPKISGHVRKI
jgi:hypothetical protein